MVLQQCPQESETVPTILIWTSSHGLRAVPMQQVLWRRCREGTPKYVREMARTCDDGISIITDDSTRGFVAGLH